MKKILILFLLIILSTSVFAYDRANAVKETKKLQEQLVPDHQYKYQEQMQEMFQEAIQNQERFTFQHRVKSNITGLNNAIIHVEHEEAVEKIQMNLEKFQEKFQYKYDKYEVTEVDGETFLQARRNFKFLIFNFNIEDEFHVGENGEIIKEQCGWVSRLLIQDA